MTRNNYYAVVRVLAPAARHNNTFLSICLDFQNSNSFLIFSLTQQSNNPFYIHADTGELIVQNELDYEFSTSYDVSVFPITKDPSYHATFTILFLQFEVVVEDKGTQPLRDTARVVVNLTDINDQRPIFGQSSFIVSVSEEFTASPSQPRMLASFQYNDGDTLQMHTRSTFSVLSVSTIGSQSTGK